MIEPRNVFPFVFGSEYEYDPAVLERRSFRSPRAATRAGSARQLTPVVGLKDTWCATVSLFVKVTVSSATIVWLFGT